MADINMVGIKPVSFSAPYSIDDDLIAGVAADGGTRVKPLPFPTGRIVRTLRSTAVRGAVRGLRWMLAPAVDLWSGPVDTDGRCPGLPSTGTDPREGRRGGGRERDGQRLAPSMICAAGMGEGLCRIPFDCNSFDRRLATVTSFPPGHRVLGDHDAHGSSTRTTVGLPTRPPVRGGRVGRFRLSPIRQTATPQADSTAEWCHPCKQPA